MYWKSVQDHRQYYKIAKHTADSATRLNMYHLPPLPSYTTITLSPTTYIHTYHIIMQWEAIKEQIHYKSVDNEIYWTVAIYGSPCFW